MLRVLALHVDFRAQGVRWPLRDDDRVEVWDDRTHVLLFTMRGELLKALLRHHLDALTLQAVLRQDVERKPPTKIEEPHLYARVEDTESEFLTPEEITAQREALRAKRKRRKQ